jgi:hypothetical protein
MMQVRVFHISPCSPQWQQTVRVTYLLLISLVPVITSEDDWEQLSFVFLYLGEDEKVHKLVYSVYLSIPISPFSTPPPGDFGEGGEEGSVRGVWRGYIHPRSFRPEAIFESCPLFGQKITDVNFNKIMPSSSAA